MSAARRPRSDPQAAARDVFERRLRRRDPRPLAVALSGGGDSLALALMADAWAREAGRDLLVLTVDHGLQADSAAWTQACAATAARLGRPFRALTWVGEKPPAGLPAAARSARHRLLAEAGRMAGARVILMGHTADDVAEAALMREAGGTTPAPREWAPSPAWPEGHDVFVLRPLLGVGRADLRAWLAARGETWIDDPANADLRFARSRARARLDRALVPEPTDRPASPLLAQVREAAGLLAIERAALQAAENAEVRRLAALACVCAGGGDRRPATARIDRLVAALRGADPFVATLAGARTEAGEMVRIFREPGEAGRGGLQPLALPQGQEVVWDGRFAAVAGRGDLTLRPLGGLAARLPREQQDAVRDLPPAARRSLPVVIDAEGAVSCPTLAAGPNVEVRSLVGDRFAAAAGLVQREPD